jgi:hypothetical protein
MRKLKFYSVNFSKYLVPKKIYELNLKNKLSKIRNYDINYIESRVNYYNKLKSSFVLSAPNNFDTFKLKTPIIIGDYIKKQSSSYFFDFREYLVYFPKNASFKTVFCDLRDIPDEPSFVKSRNISETNQNSIILKLDKARHFRFFDDNTNFLNKKNEAVFRGPCYQEHRQNFIYNNYNTPNTNFGDTRESKIGKPYHKSFMSVQEQLKYKYIVSVEGHDVATNLKWIMNSNSLCFMTRPKCETWFMEGALIPNHHYVLLNDDYSNLQEKIEYYNNNTTEALKIIKNANEYVNQFKDKKREDLISLLVIKKYFDFQNIC